MSSAARSPWIGARRRADARRARRWSCPAVTGWQVLRRPSRRCTREWSPRVGPGTVPALVLGGARRAASAAELAARLSWRLLLLVTFGAALAWMLSLATVDGLDGIRRDARTAERVPPHGPRGDRRRRDSAGVHRAASRSTPNDNWPIHLAGHPPGALLFFVGLVQIGLGSGLAAGLVVTLLAATTPVAVLLALRRLGAEVEARRAAPFLAIGTGRDLDVGVGGRDVRRGRGVGALRPRRRRHVASHGRTSPAGASRPARCSGWCVMLSYGLPLLGVLAVAVLVPRDRGGRCRGRSALRSLVVLAFAAGGFAWWDAYPVLVERYWDGIAAAATVRLLGVGATSPRWCSARARSWARRSRSLSRTCPVGSRTDRGARVIVLLVVAAAASRCFSRTSPG